jgi:putative membrane protein
MMSRILIAWLITTIAILLAAYLIPGIRIASAGAVIIGAAILGILNAFLKPILVVLTFPLTIVTLGLFLLVINALMFLLAGALVKGFEVKSFWSALLGSLIVSIVSYIAH